MVAPHPPRVVFRAQTEGAVDTDAERQTVAGGVYVIQVRNGGQDAGVATLVVAQAGAAQPDEISGALVVK